MWICNWLDVFRLLFFNANTIETIKLGYFLYHGNEVLYFWLSIKDEAATVFTMVLLNVHLHTNSSPLQMCISKRNNLWYYMFSATESGAVPLLSNVSLEPW